MFFFIILSKISWKQQYYWLLNADCRKPLTVEVQQNKTYNSLFAEEVDDSPNLG